MKVFAKLLTNYEALIILIYDSEMAFDEQSVSTTKAIIKDTPNICVGMGS